MSNKRENMAKDKREKINWHLGFYNALLLTFLDWRDALEFMNEVELNTKPYRIDVIIIKKKLDVIISNAIAHIFRLINIIEYKSPSAYLSVNGFSKAVSYCWTYKALHKELGLNELSLTLVVSKYPRKFFAQVKKDLNGSVLARDGVSGIYDIGGMVGPFPIQVVVTEELSVDDNLYLSALCGGLDTQMGLRLVTEEEKHMIDFEEIVKAYMNIISHANPELMKEVRDVSRQDFFDLMLEADYCQQRIASERANAAQSAAASAAASTARNVLDLMRSGKSEAEILKMYNLN